MDGASQAVVQGWLSTMTSFLKTLAPSQLVAAGTEGYFMDSPGMNNAVWNTGAGAACEGEDW